MKRITSAEFVRSFGHHADAALTDPVVITHHGRDRLVMLSVETYRDLLALTVAGDIAAGEAVRKSLEDLERSLARQCGMLLDAPPLPAGRVFLHDGRGNQPGNAKAPRPLSGALEGR